MEGETAPICFLPKNNFLLATESNETNGLRLGERVYVYIQEPNTLEL